MSDQLEQKHIWSPILQRICQYCGRCERVIFALADHLFKTTFLANPWNVGQAQISKLCRNLETFCVWISVSLMIPQGGLEDEKSFNELPSGLHGSAGLARMLLLVELS